MSCRAAVAIAFIAALASSARASAAASSNDTVVIDVESEVATESDPAFTERAAQREARRRVVAQALHQNAASLTMGQRALLKSVPATLADEIATTAKGVIAHEQWGPLTDGATNATKKMKLTARVSPSAIAQSICSVLKANHDPKITLVLVEKLDDDARWSVSTAKDGAFMPAVARAFEDACFTIVPSEVRIGEVSANGDLKQSDIDAIVKSSNAQYVLLGSGKVLRAPEAADGPGKRTVSLGAKLVNTSTNEIEAVAFKAAGSTATSAAEALQHNGAEVNEAVLNDLVEKVTRRWEDGPSNSSRVSFVMKNVTSSQKARAVMATFKKIMPNAGITQRAVKGGQASFDITVEGGADWIASTLEEKRVGKGDVIEIIEVSRGKVIAKLNPAPTAPK